MAGIRIPGVLGTKAPLVRKGVPEIPSIMAGVDFPGSVGTDGALPMHTITRVVVAVTKDWEPPNPKTTPAIVVHGDTLEQVFDALNRLEKWGEGGGMLRSVLPPPGRSEEITVSLHANLRKRLPRWVQYSHASVAVKAEWDRMFGNLENHEQHHVDIAVEEAEDLAAALIGVEDGEIARMVTGANRVMYDRQVHYDDDTHNGADEGVTLDPSIT